MAFWQMDTRSERANEVLGFFNRSSINIRVIQRTTDGHTLQDVGTVKYWAKASPHQVKRRKLVGKNANIAGKLWKHSKLLKHGTA
jgi:hypothetical protein